MLLVFSGVAFLITVIFVKKGRKRVKEIYFEERKKKPHAMPTRVISCCLYNSSFFIHILSRLSFVVFSESKIGGVNKGT